MCLQMAHTHVTKGIQDQVFPVTSSPFMHSWTNRSAFDGKGEPIRIALTNSMAYGIRRFNAAFTRALQLSQS